MTETRPARSERAIVVVVAVAAGVAAMTQTLVVPLLGELPRLLGADTADTSWAVTAALLGGAVTSPVIGRLGDLYGKRRLLLIVLGLLSAGSVLCAVADSLLPMIVGRALQGVGMGIVPLGISLLRDVLSPQRVGASIALTSSVLGVGAALGLPFAAMSAQFGDWHLLFWEIAAVTVLIGGLAAWLVPKAPGLARGRFDLIGALGLTSGLTALLLAISHGGEWGWSSVTTLALFAGSAALLAGWGAWELRVTDPLIDLSTAARRPVLLANIASVVVGFAMYAQTLMVPQLLQLPVATGHGLGQTMLQAGLWMVPAGVAMMSASPVGARLSAARGPKVSLMLGTVLIGLGYVACLVWMDSTGGLVFGTVVTNAGVGFAYGALPALIMGAVAPSETGAANGFNTLMRSIGSSMAGAVIGVIFAELSAPMGVTTVPLRGAFVLAAVAGMVSSLVALVVSGLIPVRKRSTVDDFPVKRVLRAPVVEAQDSPVAPRTER
ncbi:MFS transporter [Amycolatopsis nigrescens]|uniref:MFS transporter n=1 Tax=Amycolatopsis nigrescens TaxID=381445 RepID=UPI00037992F1|nr:MFS transporter [Amycolatopsis nigrescens]